MLLKAVEKKKEEKNREKRQEEERPGNQVDDAVPPIHEIMEDRQSNYRILLFS